MRKVRWRSPRKEARDEARRDGKLMLIFLRHHECDGSRVMESETYPDEGVQGY